MRKVRALVVGTTWIAGLGLAMPAPAAESEPAAPARPAYAERCGAEIAAHCAGQEAGAALGRCLAAKRAELGKGCRAALRNARRVAAFRAACGADVSQGCGGVEPGQGRIRACLAAREESLSPVCRDLLGKAGKRPAVLEEAAVADEAVREAQAGIEPLPADLPGAEEPPGEGK